MKKFYLSLLFASFLVSCVPINNQENNKEFNYDLFEQISWENLLNQNEEDYYVYVYSQHCGNCEKIKENVLDFFIKSPIKSYLIPFSESVKISSDISKSIGSTSVDDISILGTPTLLKIYDKKLIENLPGRTLILDYINSTK